PTSSATARPGGGAWSSAAACATSTSGSCASRGFHPALVEALLEEGPQVLAADRRPPNRLGNQPHLDELLALLRAVAARVALRLGQWPEPHGPHPRTRTGRIALAQWHWPRRRSSTPS